MQRVESLVGVCGAQRGEGLAGSGTGKLLVHNVNMCWSIATEKL